MTSYVAQSESKVFHDHQWWQLTTDNKIERLRLFIVVLIDASCTVVSQSFDGRVGEEVNDTVKFIDHKKLQRRRLWDESKNKNRIPTRFHAMIESSENYRIDRIVRVTR